VQYLLSMCLSRHWWIVLTGMLIAFSPCSGRLAAAAARAKAGQAGAGPTWRRIAPGVLFYEARLGSGGGAGKLWVYLPERRSGTGKLPCVLVAPAGSRLFHGMALGEGDRPEHLPYVKAGFAVVAYEIDGALGEGAGEAEVLRAARAFRKAEAGLANAREALRVVRARLPQIDAGQVYTVGHSSAATLALLVAARVPGIRACVAYAPVCDVEAWLGDRLLPLASELPGFREFIRGSSPSRNIATLRCPCFLFHADDDSTVPTAEVAGFAAQLQKSNSHVTFARVASGNHYDSMIQQGIPRAISWLLASPAGRKP
jgi:dipeptidyl aminopeptidase/acylaminoacyl peptidase